MTAHQQKKLDLGALRQTRDRFALALSDSDLEEMLFDRPPSESKELRYLRERRASLGGNLPVRRSPVVPIAVPKLESFANFAIAANGKDMSTTMAAVRLFNALLRDNQLGPRVVPIVADEAPTFGMDNMFRQVGIYAPEGQLYQPQDAESMLFYREATDGQLLEEGINEAGQPMLPFYIFYSMFGFQRVGDLIWAAADQRSRGFLIGATAAARRSAARVYSIRTVRATSSPRPCRTAVRTIPRSHTKLR